MVSFRKAKNMERKESYKSSDTISGSSDVEYQALLAELKQKDKQREELLMNLKVCLNFIYLQYLNRLAQFSLKLNFKGVCIIIIKSTDLYKYIYNYMDIISIQILKI